MTQERKPGDAPTQRIQIQKLDAQGHADGPVISAQFNPTSLQYTITNTAAQGSGRQRSRKVDESTGKLTMELVYDTTHTGQDVRKDTQKIAQLMQPAARQLTPLVEITWGGVFKFKGALDQYRETLDFFSEDGVPLRASLSLGFSTVSDQNTTPPEVFAFASTEATHAIDIDDALSANDDAFEVPVPRHRPVSEVASNLGDPGRMRSIAAFNLVEDLRNGSDIGGVLAVSDEVILDGPVAFATGGAGASAGFGFGASGGAGFSAGFGFSAGATAGASFGASAGVSAGVSAGFGASASSSFGATASAGASFGASASAGFGASASESFSASGGGFAASASVSASASASGGGFAASASFEASAEVNASGTLIEEDFSASYSTRAGSAASAHVSASEGAFAGLRPPSTPRRRAIDVARVLREPASRRVTTDNPTAFGPGGRALSSGTSSTNAEVGQSFSLRERIEFED
jgi:hypothetical protein